MLSLTEKQSRLFYKLYDAYHYIPKHLQYKLEGKERKSHNLTKKLEYRSINREKYLEYNRMYYQKNREILKKMANENYDKHRKK